MSTARWSRRELVKGLTFTAVAGRLGMSPTPAAGEPPPETMHLRLGRGPGICIAPYYVAEELLPAEGFTRVEYVKTGGPADFLKALTAGDLDVAYTTAWSLILWADAGAPVVFVAGLHGGCYELFATEPVRSLRDLRGKRLAVPFLGSGPHAFLVTMLAHVGVDPKRDVTFVEMPAEEGMRRLAEGTIAAYMAFPPENQELREKKVGRVIVNTGTERPWSQYFCCMVLAHRDFVRRHPVATKRAVRAVLKANDLCAAEPDRVARFLVDRGYTKRYDFAVEVLREIPYRRWRDYDAEDTMRFYALRLHETGMLRSSPKKLLAESMDVRLLNELKRELKD
jgi:NitT/TauT family transport system substrate-binding protein